MRQPSALNTKALIKVILDTVGSAKNYFLFQQSGHLLAVAIAMSPPFKQWLPVCLCLV